MKTLSDQLYISTIAEYKPYHRPFVDADTHNVNTFLAFLAIVAHYVTDEGYIGKNFIISFFKIGLTLL